MNYFGLLSQVTLRVCNLYVQQWGAQIVMSPQGQQLVAWLADQLNLDKLRDKGALMVADTCIAALQRLEASSIAAMCPVLTAAATIVAAGDTVRAVA